MSTLNKQILTVFFGLALIAGGVVMFLPLTSGLGPLRWGLGVPMLLSGLGCLALLPRYSQEKLPADASFQPLRQAEPGSVLSHWLAAVLDRELRDTPHEVEFSDDSVRVSYDSGAFYEPGAPGLRQFNWRTTLAPTSDPRTFVRLDQAFDHKSGYGWGQAKTDSGLRWSGSGSVTIDSKGTVAKQGVTTGDITSAIKVAMKETGARLAYPTDALAALVCAAAGVLLAIGVVVGGIFM